MTVQSDLGNELTQVRIAPHQLQGASLLVLLVRTNAQYREEFSWISGRVMWDEGAMYVDRGNALPTLAVPDFLLDDIKPCDESIRQAFEPCEYLLTIRIEPPGDAELPLFESVGLKWES